jgi:hypothetical protein
MLVILGSLIMACACAYQAIYTVRTGQVVWFVGPPAASPPLPWLWPRIAYALVYLIPSAGIFAILARSAIRGGLSRIEVFVAMNLGDLVASLLFMVPGLLLVLQPAKMLRWTVRTNPELAEDKSVLLMTRCIGVGFIAMGARILSAL